MEELALGRRDGHLVGRGETYKDMEMGCGEKDSCDDHTTQQGLLNERENAEGGKE